MLQEDGSTERILHIFEVQHHHLSSRGILSREEKDRELNIHPIPSSQMVSIGSRGPFYQYVIKLMSYHTRYGGGGGFLEMFFEYRDG